MLTERQLREIRRELRNRDVAMWTGAVTVVEHERGRSDLRIELTKWDFGNVIDSNSMQGLLAWLQEKGFVGKQTKTMWLGMYEGKMYLWCVI